MKKNVTRVNISISESLKEFYREYAAEMGSTMSGVMVMALKQYMDAQKGMKMGADLKALVNNLEELKKMPTIEIKAVKE